jgi:hypothetical protein
VKILAGKHARKASKGKRKAEDEVDIESEGADGDIETEEDDISPPGNSSLNGSEDSFDADQPGPSQRPRRGKILPNPSYTLRFR